MPRLNGPIKKDLSKTDFDQHPVWVWDDDNEHLRPISEACPSPDEYGSLFIKAIFQAGGHVFDGYLIGSDKYYAFAFFVGNEEIVMNMTLLDLVQDSAEKIKNHLRAKEFKLFPVSYWSPVRLKGDRIIQGVFSGV